MSFVFFSFGVIIGVMAAYIYLKLERESAQHHWQNLEARLQIIEEQCSYLAVRIEEGHKAPQTTRQRKGPAKHEGHHRALSLLAEGSDPSSVARATNMPLGQVELLNKLHRKDG